RTRYGRRMASVTLGVKSPSAQPSKTSNTGSRAFMRPAPSCARTCARLDTPRVPNSALSLAPLTYIAADSHQLSKTGGLGAGTQSTSFLWGGMPQLPDHPRVWRFTFAPTVIPGAPTVRIYVTPLGRVVETEPADLEARVKAFHPY